MNTKIREFVEETGLYHPQFKCPSKMNVFHNFKEEWIGLDNVHYKANYSLFIVQSLSELVEIEKNQQNIIELLYSDSSKKHLRTCGNKCYYYNEKYDSKKIPTDIPIEYLNLFMSNNKYFRIVDIDLDQIINILDSHYKKSN